MSCDAVTWSIRMILVRVSATTCHGVILFALVYLQQERIVAYVIVRVRLFACRSLRYLKVPVVTDLHETFSGPGTIDYFFVM